MQSGVKTLSAGGGASLCCLLLLWLIYSHLLREGQLAVGTCEIVMLNRDSSVPRRTIARQTARCACRRGQIAGTTRARPACVDARIVRSRQWCEMSPCMDGEVCSLLFNRSGWTCTRGSGRIKTVTLYEVIQWEIDSSWVGGALDGAAITRCLCQRRRRRMQQTNRKFVHCFTLQEQLRQTTSPGQSAQSAKRLLHFITEGSTTNIKLSKTLCSSSFLFQTFPIWLTHSTKLEEKCSPVETSHPFVFSFSGVVKFEGWSSVLCDLFQTHRDEGSCGSRSSAVMLLTR